MSSFPKTPPRFLPTLTEVVSPGEVRVAEPLAAPTTEVPQFDPQAIVERVMQQLAPTLEARLRNVIGVLVEEHMRALEPHLMQEVEHALRDVVTQTVTAELESQQHRAGY